MEPDAVLAVHRAPVACRIEAIDGKGVAPQPLVEAVHDPDAAHLEFARRAIGADFAGIGIGDPKLHAPKRRTHRAVEPVGQFARIPIAAVRADRLGHSDCGGIARRRLALGLPEKRSEAHTSELQSLLRTSYAVFCLKKKK